MQNENKNKKYVVCDITKSNFFGNKFQPAKITPTALTGLAEI